MTTTRANAEPTSRERVTAAIHHREPDRLPFDLGGTVVTGIHHHAYRRLRRHLGLPQDAMEIEDVRQQLALVGDDVRARLRVDTCPIKPGPPHGFTMPRWAEDGYDKLRDEWGIEWWRPQDGGFYYDMRKHPLADVGSVHELSRWQFPDPRNPGRFERLAARADDALNRRQMAGILGRHTAGMFEMASWLRGFETFYCDMLADRPMAEALLDIVCENKMEYWRGALAAVGADVMIVAEADDLASQDRLLMAPELYRDLLKPRHARLFECIRKHAAADVKIFFHSCGAVAPLIPDLIEAGVDILNPVQVSADGMDTRELKRRFGRDITFWGGGVDTQYMLPRGTPAEVRDEVRRRIDDLAPGGGFVFATVHNIQADVPPENIEAMWETLQEYGAGIR